MLAGRNRHTLLLTMVLIIGLITVAVPVCFSAACDISSGSMPSHMTPMFTMVCDMVSTTAGVVDGSLPTAAPSLLVGLFAVLALAVLSIGPSPSLLRLPALVGDPPASPDNLGGVRLLI